MTPKIKSLLIIIVFTLILILPVAYAMVKNYFFVPQTEMKQGAQPEQGKK